MVPVAMLKENIRVVFSKDQFKLLDIGKVSDLFFLEFMLVCGL